MKQTSNIFEITDQPVNSRSHRHCAWFCHGISQCLAADFEGELNLCRLYNDINGTTTAEEGDFSLVREKFGVCKFLCSDIKSIGIF